MRNKEFNEGLLKKYIIYTIAICRTLIIILIPVLTGFGKIFEADRKLLLCFLLPITTLYLVFVFKVIYSNKRYLLPGNVISASNFTSRFVPLFLLLVIEILVIIFNQQLFTPLIDPIYPLLSTIECILAAFTGFYLSNFFALQIPAK